MNLKKCKYMVCSLIIAGLLVLGVLWLLNGAPRVARAANGIRYVAPGGSDLSGCKDDANPCRTIQHAIDDADEFDAIWVAGGVYTGTAGTVADIGKTLILLGGWDATFTTRDPVANPTTLDAQSNGRVVYISGSITPTLDGFIITNGNATSETIDAGMGGGIFSEYASPIIQNNVIISNTASISPTNGRGGGIYMYDASASALISGNLVLSNTVYAGPVADCGGGGLYLYYSGVTVQDNLIQGNTNDRRGGGILIRYGAPRILDNEIRANESDSDGGGIYSRDGGQPLIKGNLIVNNIAGGYGGGMCSVNGDQPTIVANRIFSNTASVDGGLSLWWGYFTVTNNLIAHNDNGGIGLGYVHDCTIAHNTIAFNTGPHGGIYLGRYITPTIINNIVVSNTYGIRAHTDASGTLDYNDVWGNTALDYDLPGALEPGVHSIQADPLFVDPAGDDYHLQAGSPCVDAGVVTDFDGDPRPIGRPDLGAYEWGTRIYLPLALRSYP